ncbi:STP1 protein [Plasmodium malariae]|uniref:STP1 protein n=1 Tax=Plasmodium malariae TaxID=5858 RepID=A0A1D3JH95_PLAMA|nr:STP1 protein [Plasmodium malariae]SBT85599.1 STP1 protein [Plasmodium malariae]
MEKCLPKNLRIFGTSYFRYAREARFREVVNHIKDNITKLISNKDKEALKDKCLYLARYLIDNKTPPNYYISEKKIWERALNEWLHPHYKKLDKLGGCPLIMEEKHFDILKLKYEVDNFCKERITHLNELRQSQRNPKSDSSYSSKCDSYNVWIDQKEKYFTTKKHLIESCYERNQTKKDPKRMCNIMDLETFKKQPNCTLSHPVLSGKDLSTEKNKATSEVSESRTESVSTTKDAQQEVGQDLSESEAQPQVQTQPRPQHEGLSTPESGIENESQTLPLVTPPSEASYRKSENINAQGEQSLEAEESDPNGFVSLYSYKSPQSTPLQTKPDISTEKQDFQIVSSSSERSNDATNFPLNTVHSKIPKNIVYDNEETIKKIKINEHNMNNNIHMSKQKKDRYKTIIELHMQILEEYRNEEWEYVKGEFLEICLEFLTKGEHETYSYLTNDEQIIGNTKSINQKGKQKILWNKWIEKHQNLADKLKKEHWFNNLKNDWKRELANLKKKEELKNDPDEIQNIPFSQREKYIWRQWISEKCIIIKQYIEQDLFNYLTDELQIIPDDYDNEKIKDSLPLINIGELSNKEDCQELYKYIKKKLLTKLCILVLMSVLEECKKEQDIEKNESHLDNYIIEFKEKENSDSKKEFIENISEFNRYFLENTENHDYKTDDIFKKELERWIREDNTYEYSMEK